MGYMVESQDKNSKQGFQYLDKANLDIETPKTNMGFWRLSRKSDITGLGTGDSRSCTMCRRCGAVIGDYLTHVNWHRNIEKIDIENVSVSASYL